MQQYIIQMQQKIIWKDQIRFFYWFLHTISKSEQLILS